MAKAKYALIALFLFSASFAQAYKEQRDAVTILRAAAIKAPKSLKTTFVQMANILNRADVRIPPAGYDFNRCGETTLAYVVPRVSKTIFLCRLVLSGSSIEITQTLIHEAAHLVGYLNECHATAMEVAAMRLSGVGLAYRNGYMDRCGY